ncbi:MAG: MotA/TolQ/ExbB proton channel family protein [Luteolibacter sp.]
MIPRFTSACLAATFLSLGSLLSAGPLETAQEDLKKAVADLNSTQAEYADLRRALYREINTLDDEATKLSRELRALNTAYDRSNVTSRSLDATLQMLESDFNYSSGILNQYSKALVTRMHPAENQLYKESIDQIDQRAISLAGDPKAELAERIKVLEAGIARIGEVAGGRKFEGKALRNGSKATPGEFLLLGPSVFFASRDKDFEGVSTFAEAGTSLPTVVGIKASDGLIVEGVANNHGLLPFDGTMGKAIMVEASQENIFEVAEKGGIVGYAILALGGVSVLLALFKVYQVSRITVPSRKKLNKIIDDLLNEDVEAARANAAKLSGPGGKLVQTGVDMFYEKRRVLEEALFEQLVQIKPRLDAYLPFLGLTAAAAPLMGLLGTVLGIIKTFKAMALYGTGNAKSFSAGISEALITTAEGLVVAIPVLVIHGLLKSYTKGRFSDFEQLGISIINSTTERDSSLPPPPGAGPNPDDDEDNSDDENLMPTSPLTPDPA